MGVGKQSLQLLERWCHGITRIVLCGVIIFLEPLGKVVKGLL